MHNSQNSNSISRRAFVKGGMAAASVASLGGASLLSSTQLSSAAIGARAPKFQSQSLVEHLCTVSHSYLNDKLTKMVADPTVSKEDTALALRTTHCPYCDTQISASYPAVPLYQAA